MSMGKKSKAVDIGVNDRVSVFLELAEAHRVIGEQVSSFHQQNMKGVFRVWDKKINIWMFLLHFVLFFNLYAANL